MDTNKFIQKARAVHGDRFDYSATKYTRAHSLVTIICKEHGPFTQKAYSHLNGRGCGECSGTKRHSTETFIKAARRVHGEKYDYSAAKYVNNKTKIAIICGEHGVFYQVPNSHLSGRGCVKCAKTSYQKDKTGNVYLLMSDCGGFMKIGITNNPKQRFSELRSKTPFGFVVLALYPMRGEFAPIIERGVHELGESAGLSGFCGATEWFNYNLNLEYTLHKAAEQLGISI
jgi:hypothetical protein